MHRTIGCYGRRDIEIHRFDEADPQYCPNLGVQLAELSPAVLFKDRIQGPLRAQDFENPHPCRRRLTAGQQSR